MPYITQAEIEQQYHQEEKLRQSLRFSSSGILGKELTDSARYFDLLSFKNGRFEIREDEQVIATLNLPENSKVNWAVLASIGNPSVDLPAPAALVLYYDGRFEIRHLVSGQILAELALSNKLVRDSQLFLKHVELSSNGHRFFFHRLKKKPRNKLVAIRNGLEQTSALPSIRDRFAAAVGLFLGVAFDVFPYGPAELDLSYHVATTKSDGSLVSVQSLSKEDFEAVQPFPVKYFDRPDF